MDWILGLKTYLKTRRLWKHIATDTSLTESDLKDSDPAEQIESEQAGVLEIIRATVPPTRLPVIRGIEDPKKAYDTLVTEVSQDDGLEVAALIAKVATIQYSGSETATTFLEGINDLHTQLAEATAKDDYLRISNKLLAVFLLLSFPGDQFSTIRDQLFGDLKNLTTTKVTSCLRTKSTLTSVDDTAIAMATTAQATRSAVPRTVAPCTDKSATAPCVLREHWQYPQTNGVCSKQHRENAITCPPVPQSTSHSSPTVSDTEKIRALWND